MSGLLPTPVTMATAFDNAKIDNRANRGARGKNNGRTVKQTNSNEVSQSTEEMVSKAFCDHQRRTYQGEIENLKLLLDQERAKNAVANHTATLISSPSEPDASIEGHPIVRELRQTLAAKSVAINALPEVIALKTELSAKSEEAERANKESNRAFEDLEVEKAANLELMKRLMEPAARSADIMPSKNPPGVPGTTVIDIENMLEKPTLYSRQLDALASLTQSLHQEITVLWNKAPGRLSRKGELTGPTLINSLGISRSIGMEGSENKEILPDGLLGRFQRCCEQYSEIIASINASIKALKELQLKEAEILAPITPAMKKVILPKLLLSEDWVTSKETQHDASYKRASALLTTLETTKAKVENELYYSRKEINYIWKSGYTEVFKDPKNCAERIADFLPIN